MDCAGRTRSRECIPDKKDCIPSIGYEPPTAIPHSSKARIAGELTSIQKSQATGAQADQFDQFEARLASLEKEPSSLFSSQNSKCSLPESCLAPSPRSPGRKPKSRTPQEMLEEKVDAVTSVEKVYSVRVDQFEERLAWIEKSLASPSGRSGAALVDSIEFRLASFEKMLVTLCGHVEAIQADLSTHREDTLIDVEERLELQHETSQSELLEDFQKQQELLEERCKQQEQAMHDSNSKMEQRIEELIEAYRVSGTSGQAGEIGSDELTGTLGEQEPSTGMEQQLRSAASRSSEPDQSSIGKISEEQEASRNLCSGSTVGMLDQAIKQLSRQTETNSADFCTFHESIWDTAFLIGTHEMGSLASVFVALLVVINASIQLGLCMMINDTFTAEAIKSDRKIAMREWRVTSGHSFENMNPYTFQPLVKSVCLGSGTPFDSEAAHLLNDITEYLPTRDDYEQNQPLVGPLLPYLSHFGVIMSSIAILIWLMRIISDIQTICYWCDAILNTPRGEHTVITKGKGTRSVSTMTNARRCWILLILLVECVVVVSLGMSGAFFILRTIHPRELLLNCSALAIVLELDEEFFSAFVPQSSRLLVRSLEDLPRPPSYSIGGMSCNAVLAPICVIIFLTFSISALNQQATTLQETRNEICQGDLDFLATQDSSGIVTAVIPADPVDLQDTYMFHAMTQLILNTDGSLVRSGLGGEEDASASVVGVKDGPWSLEGWTSANLDTVMSIWNYDCVDMLPTSTGTYEWSLHFLHVIHDALGNRSVQSCNDIKQYCNHDGNIGIRTRQACPVTCSCDRFGPQPVIGGMNGCSPTCRDTPAYNASKWSRDCEDLSLDSPYWAEHAEGIRRYVDSYPSGPFSGKEFVNTITSNGCGMVSKGLTILGGNWENPCEFWEGYRLEPFTYACPISCRCSGRSRYLCPATCRTSQQEGL